MQLIVNGEVREIADKTTVSEFLTSLDLAPKMVVVERNGDIVPRDLYEMTSLLHGDLLEIVHMMAGG